MRARLVPVLSLLAGLGAAAPRGAAAQDVQVPIDDAGKLLVITADLERKLGLFAEYAQFREARLFRTSDTSFVLEVTHEPAGQLTRVRIPLSLAAAQALRDRVSAKVRETAPEATLDQSGRTKLLVWSTMLSLLYYGPAVPVTLGVDDSQGAVGAYMLSAGTGFFLPFLATKRIPVTEAGAVLGTYGATRGIFHGALATLLFDSDPSDRALTGASLLGGVAEGIAGFAAANAGRMTAGTAELVGVGGDFGLGYGLGLSHLAGFFGSSDPFYVDDESEAAIAAVSLLGAVAGAAAGHVLSRTEPYTRGDVFFLRNAGFLGAHAGLALADAFNADGDQDKLYTALAMAGATGGLTAGRQLVRGRRFTTAQGTLGTLGLLAGSFTGLGLVYLVSSEDADNSVVLWSASAVGGALGYGLLYSSFARQAGHARGPGSIDVQVEPAGLAAAVTGRRSQPQRPLPVVRVSYRF